MQSKLEDLLRWESGSRGEGTKKDEFKRERLVRHLVELGRVNADSGVLSVGCGTGYYELIVRKYTNHLFCLDLSQEALAICKMRGFRNLIRGSALCLPFRQDTFDCVYALSLSSIGSGSATEYTRKTTVQEMKHVARKGGRIVIGHPTTIWKQIRGLLRSGKLNIDNFRVSPREAKRAFKQNNLNVPTNMILPPVPYAILQRIKYLKTDRILSRLLLNEIGPYLLMFEAK